METMNFYRETESLASLKGQLEALGRQVNFVSFESGVAVNMHRDNERLLPVLKEISDALSKASASLSDAHRKTAELLNDQYNLSFQMDQAANNA